MRISLTQSDIELAIQAHLAAQGIVLSGKVFSATFKAGRKGRGLSAVIELVDAPKLGLGQMLPVEATVTTTPAGFQPGYELPPSQPIQFVDEEPSPVVTVDEALEVAAATPVTISPFDLDTPIDSIEPPSYPSTPAPVKPPVSLFA